MELEAAKQLILKYTSFHSEFMRNAQVAIRYYLGKNDILYRKPKKELSKEEGAHPLRNADNKIAFNFHQLLVNQKASYLFTAPPLFVKEFHWTLKQYIKAAKENGITKDWSKELENASAKFHITRLQSLEMQIRQHLEYLYGNYLDGMYEAMQDTYQDSFYNTAYELQAGTKTAFEIKLIPRHWKKSLSCPGQMMV